MTLGKSLSQTPFSHWKGRPISWAHDVDTHIMERPDLAGSGRHRQQKPRTGHTLLHPFLTKEAEASGVLDNLTHRLLQAF